MFGAFQNIHNAPTILLHVDRLAVGQQVQVALGVQRLRETLRHLTLQKAQHAPDLLERKSFLPQFGYDADLHNLFERIQPAVPLVARGYHLLLIPPLQLAETDVRKTAHIR